MSDSEQTRFLNVDLDLKARAGLMLLVRALHPALIALHASDQEATLELASQPSSAAQAIEEISKEVARLPAGLRSAWDSCLTRNMDVGVAAGRAPHQVLFALPHSTLLQLTEMGTGLAFTVYAADPPSAPPPRRRSKAPAVKRRGGARRARRKAGS